MNGQPGVRVFLIQYFPVFMGAIFASVFALVFAVPLFFDSYFQALSLADNAKWSFFGGVALTLVIVHCNFMIARGRPVWVWPMVAVLGLCFFCVLPTIAYRPDRLIYSLSLLFPLLGLLLLNSKRHREMRSKLVEIRHQRERILQSAKTSRPRR
ncbi:MULTISPECIES: hypothetical protein [Pseudomonas]|jgi:hypothetical protein|uniref:hypothetical protein n=1 Tax=Pseudomonas TaxID=286 RepID=UPI00057484AB|nr:MULTISPECIES: hypothetical protein [Pseudomonas]KJH87945.1 membrane protein [Pseudomonas fluorescens]MBI6617656.1 hypothetical protein [Pseudomonas corrugata]MBI6692025.1 hypothetical protein [Pseudomonas corrugata]WRV69029.1 hypothetical protein VQ575_02910 [Pseudomonas frederiksbergensis]